MLLCSKIYSCCLPEPITLSGLFGGEEGPMLEFYINENIQSQIVSGHAH